MTCSENPRHSLDTKAQLIIIDNISKLLPDLLKAEDVTRFIEFVNRVACLQELQL